MSRRSLAGYEQVMSRRSLAGRMASGKLTRRAATATPASDLRKLPCETVVWPADLLIFPPKEVSNMAPRQKVLRRGVPLGEESLCYSSVDSSAI
jgi:hypothetical protein